MTEPEVSLCGWCLLALDPDGKCQACRGAERGRAQGVALVAELEAHNQRLQSERKERDAVKEDRAVLKAELNECREKVDLLMQPVPEAHGLWCANYAQEKQAWRAAERVTRTEFEELAKQRDHLQSELATTASLDQQSERIAELHVELNGLLAERDRLRQWLTEANAKHRVHKREIRRLQAALMRERGSWRWEKVEYLERVVRELEAAMCSRSKKDGSQ